MARELAPVGLRSSPIFWRASRPSGSKLPRHRATVVRSSAYLNGIGASPHILMLGVSVDFVAHRQRAFFLRQGQDLHLAHVPQRLHMSAAAGVGRQFAEADFACAFIQRHMP